MLFEKLCSILNCACKPVVFIALEVNYMLAYVTGQYVI